MNLRKWCLTGPLILVMGVTCRAQTISGVQDTKQRVGSPIAPAVAPATPADPASPATPAPPKPKKTPAIEGEAMPFDRIEKPTSLDAQLDAIRDKLPEFNSVIVRDPTVPADYPTLPPMTLKNVTLGQFLQFVQASYPVVQIIRIDGQGGSLYSIRVRAEGDALKRATAMTEQNRVRLYRLNDVINAQVQDMIAKGPTTLEIGPQDASKDSKTSPPGTKTVTEDRSKLIKQATDDVLSLLQAALDQTDVDGPSTLKIHEPTLTLMFKGSLAKQQVLEEALNTLQPTRGRRVGYNTQSNPWAGPQSSSNLFGSEPPADQYRLLQKQMSDLDMQAKEVELRARDLAKKEAAGKSKD